MKQLINSKYIEVFGMNEHHSVIIQFDYARLLRPSHLIVKLDHEITIFLQIDLRISIVSNQVDTKRILFT